MDRIDAMRLFMRVADAGSFSKAAQDLGIGQPTVSRRIQDLEHRLGADLFLRTTRALALTEAGSRFYDRAGDILAQYDDAEAEARGLDREPVGLLRITAPQSLGRLVIAPHLNSFLKLYPHVRIDMILDDTFTDLVEEGVDLAFRIGTLPDSSMMARRMGETGRALWAAPAYLEEFGTPDHPEQLADHNALLFRQLGKDPVWTFERGDEIAEVKVNGRFQASSGDVLVEAACDGLGILLTTDWLVAAAARQGRLVRVLPDWQAAPAVIHCVWTSGKLKGKAKLFAEHMAEALKFTEAA